MPELHAWSPLVRASAARAARTAPADTPVRVPACVRRATRRARGGAAAAAAALSHARFNRCEAMLFIVLLLALFLNQSL